MKMKKENYTIVEYDLTLGWLRLFKPMLKREAEKRLKERLSWEYYKKNDRKIKIVTIREAETLMTLSKLSQIKEQIKRYNDEKFKLELKLKELIDNKRGLIGDVIE